MSFNVHVSSLLHIKILTIRSSNFFLNKNKWNNISGSGGVQAGKCHVNASPHGCLEVSIPDLTSCTYPFVFPQHCFPSQCTRLVSQAKILGVSSLSVSLQSISISCQLYLQHTSRIWPLLLTFTPISLVQAATTSHPGHRRSHLTSLPASTLVPVVHSVLHTGTRWFFKNVSQLLFLLSLKPTSGSLLLSK